MRGQEVGVQGMRNIGKCSFWLCPKLPREMGIDFRARLQYTIE